MNAYTAYGRAAHFYRTTEAQTSVDNPAQRLELTLAGILAALANAQRAIHDRQIATRGEQTSRAMMLIGILRSALDHQAAPELAQRLDSLYTYCNRRLLMVSLGEVKALQEVIDLLVTLKDGWDAVAAQPKSLAA
ncbi:MAG TPA: flagellar export chaperone FliS [Nevskiaceae bacterium]|nr:flagellar export chaperone FliS [Nevskiaceae bacterium]